MEENPHQRAAQKALAEEVTERVHGQTGLSRARKASEVLFGGELAGLGADEIGDIFADVPSREISRDTLGGEGMQVVDLLLDARVASSKGDARRSIQGGGVYLNNIRVSEIDQAVTVGDAVEGRFIVLRKGKKSYTLVKVLG